MVFVDFFCIGIQLFESSEIPQFLIVQFFWYAASIQTSFYKYKEWKKKKYLLMVVTTWPKLFYGPVWLQNTINQWLRQISILLSFDKLNFSKGSKREKSISNYSLLFGFHQNSISSTKNSVIMLEWEDSIKNRYWGSIYKAGMNEKVDKSNLEALGG